MGFQRRKAELFFIEGKDLVHARAAVAARSLHRRAAILHGHLLGFLHLFLRLALHAVSDLSHGLAFLWFGVTRFNPQRGDVYSDGPKTVGEDTRSIGSARPAS